MSKKKLHIPLTAAALAILLAACGGSGGDGANSTGSSGVKDAAANAQTPAADTAAPATNAPAPAASPANAPAPAANTQVPGSVAPTSPRATPVAAAATPISATGIRGDVLLGMLEQQPCSNSWFTPVAGPDGSNHSAGQVNTYANAELGNYTDRTDIHVVHTIGCSGQTYAPVQAGEHTYRFGNGYFGRFNGPPHAEIRHTALNIPVTVSDQDVVLGKDMKSYAPRTETEPGGAVDMSADAELRLAYNAEIPFGTVMHWKGPNAQYVHMFIDKGDGSDPNKVRLCFDNNMTNVKQLQCISWKVPADWQPHQEKLEDVEQTLISDRSVFPGKSGHSYWKTTR